MLAALGADVKRADEQGLTPIHQAIHSKYPSRVLLVFKPLPGILCVALSIQLCIECDQFIIPCIIDGYAGQSDEKDGYVHYCL